MMSSQQCKVYGRRRGFFFSFFFQQLNRAGTRSYHPQQSVYLNRLCACAVTPQYDLLSCTLIHNNFSRTKTLGWFKHNSCGEDVGCCRNCWSKPQLDTSQVLGTALMSHFCDLTGDVLVRFRKAIALATQLIHLYSLVLSIIVAAQLKFPL